MKKKLLFIINAMGGGGAERAASTLLGSPRFREELDIDLVLLEKKIKYEIPADIPLHFATNLDESANKVEKALSLKKMVDEVRKIKEKMKPDVSISFLTRANIINIMTRTGSEKILISERNNPRRTYSGSSFTRLFHRNLIGHFYPKADGITAVSDGVRDSLASYIGIDKSKIRTIHNPYDIDGIREATRLEMEDDMKRFFGEFPVIITTGRLIPQKGQDVLLEALPEILGKHTVNLVIIGTGDLEESLKQKAHELGINERVYFAGWRENPFRWESKASVFVLPSRWEGFPNALVEAMACGVPVVASHCESGPGEILLNNEYGLLAKTGDSKDLAEKIIFLLDNPAEQENYARKAAERAGDFHRDRIAGEYVDYISSLETGLKTNRKEAKDSKKA